MITVALIPSDVLLGGMVGLMRITSGLKMGHQREPGRKDLFEHYVGGAIAEYAAARALGINWNPRFGHSDTARGDVGHYHIKCITNPRYCLVIQKDDKPEFPYILVYLTHHKATLIGKIDGHLGKQAKFWREKDVKAGIHQAAFFVPQSELELFD